jgi:8-oxo-dGTP pyrophosphatase MutT (NUDIX family)
VTSVLDKLTADDLRQLAASRLKPDLRGDHGDHYLNPDSRDWVVDRARRPAAVLVPMITRNGGLNIILTRRTDHLSSHSGQIAFPGGKIDKTDINAEAAALREAHEEISLKPELAEIIGRLPDYYTGSGYRISPVVALIDSGAQMRPNPQEVDYIFEVPVAFLMDPANHHRASRKFKGRDRHFFEMPYGKHYIWGITAGIIHMMHERMFK